MNDTNKPKRGRPAGSTSFIRVRLRDLVRHLGEDNTAVVSKKWLTQVGLAVKTESPLIQIQPVSDGGKNKIEFIIE